MQLSLATQRRDQAVDLTGMVNEALTKRGWQQGCCHLFVPHTTAAITLNEGFDSAVLGDALAGLAGLIPWQGAYDHLEGNSAAHIKSMLVGISLSLPVENGCLALGQWQKVFFMEFDGPRKRCLRLTFSPTLI